MLTKDQEAEAKSAAPAPATRTPPPTGPEQDSSPMEPDAREVDGSHEARVEQLLSEIRSTLDASARDQQYKEFSAARLAGSITQALVLGLLAWALSDWVFRTPAQELYIKLGFAGVLQLAALTAFIISREDPR